MTAADIYLSALRGWTPPKAKHPKPIKRTKPVRLPGGCLLYRFPDRRAG